MAFHHCRLRAWATFAVVVSLFPAWTPNGASRTRSLSFGQRPSAKAPVFTEETPRATYAFVNSIGVNTHLNYFDTSYGRFDTVKSALQDLGVLHLRDGVHLQNDDYNRAVYGRWIQLSQLGIRFDAALDPRNKLGPITPALLDRVMKLAGGSIESFEGANELDISQIPDWPKVDADFQQSIYRAVQGMQHPVPVIGPSMASAANGRKLGNLSEFLDFGNLHPYPAGKPPSVIFPEQTDLARAVSGSKPIWFTETGYHDAMWDLSDQPAVSEKAAAKYIPRLFLEDFLHGIPRTYLYELFDEKPDPNRTHEQQHWGLVRADGSRKPAFTALANLISELNGAQQPVSMTSLAWRLSAPQENLQHLLLEDAQGAFYLVLWNDVSCFNRIIKLDITNAPVPETLELRRKARTISIFEPGIQAGPLSTTRATGHVSLAVPDEPLVVRIQF